MYNSINVPYLPNYEQYHFQPTRKEEGGRIESDEKQRVVLPDI
jgi:hypothetical protein